MIISTTRLISASEARKRFGQLLADVHENEKNYYVILENGKVAALLVHPHWLQETIGEDFPDLEKLRVEWGRYAKNISQALNALEKIDSDDLPALLK